METWNRILERIESFLSIPIFHLGQSEITLGMFVYVFLLFVAVLWVTNVLRRLLERKLLAYSRLDLTARQAFGAIFQYLVIVLGGLVIVQTAGIDLTTINILAGAVGIGVGFGLQNIANNLISGLIILFERPIQVGDRIEVGSTEGDVVRIGARSTTVITNDNIAVVVPNAQFITETVINWSYTDPKIRFRIPVAVAYGTDSRQVEKLLLEIADENPDVLKDPAPAVRFVDFGDNGLKFELRAWTTTLLHRRGVLVSALNFAIYDKFRAHGIEFPFPQRDIHIRSGWPPPAREAP